MVIFGTDNIVERNLTYEVMKYATVGSTDFRKWISDGALDMDDIYNEEEKRNFILYKYIPNKK